MERLANSREDAGLYLPSLTRCPHFARLAQAMVRDVVSFREDLSIGCADSRALRGSRAAAAPRAPATRKAAF